MALSIITSEERHYVIAHGEEPRPMSEIRFALRFYWQIAVWCCALGCALSASAETPKLWFYYPTNLLPDENIPKLQAIWQRAAAAGYSTVLLSDSKFARLRTLPEHYFANCRKVRQIARNLKLDIVPAVFPVGYSNDILYNDPNLAEGLPVNDTLCIVHDGSASCTADPPVTLAKPAFTDQTVHIVGNVATVHGDAVHHRFAFKLALPEFRCYHVSVEIKTQGYTAHPQIVALAGDRGLTFTNLDVKPTQDWKRQDIIFNTLDNENVMLYFGVWDQAKGTLFWRNWKIEEIGLLNVLRRDGTPCTVKVEGGRTCEEGKDYDPISDPHMGNDPWPGEYQVWHEPPVIHTRLPEGTRLRVSWYHPVVIYDEQVCGCISDPKMMALLADQAKQMKEVWNADGYMMSHDEFRVFNWDASCAAEHRTPGQLLAENVRRCTDLLRPKTAYVWSDMFDPYHNAVTGPYYLVNGPWTGSWEGLDKSVVIVNWNYEHRDQSLKFFADRGNSQVLAGYYDGPLSDWKNWLVSARSVPNVVGYLYTTWSRNYDHLEEFATIARESAGRQ
jgi:hypothetical protein